MEPTAVLQYNAIDQLSLGVSEALHWWVEREPQTFQDVWLGAHRNPNVTSDDIWLAHKNATSVGDYPDGKPVPGFNLMSHIGSPWLPQKDSMQGDCVALVVWSNLQHGFHLRQDNCSNKYAYACVSVPVGSTS